MEFIQEKNDARKELPYDIDGVVIKLDDLHKLHLQILQYS